MAGFGVVDKFGEFGADHAGGCVETQAGYEVGHHGKWGALVEVSDAGFAVGGELVAYAVEDEHLAVEGVEGAEAEVAFAQDVADGELAVVDAVEKCGHQRVLENGVAGDGFRHGCDASRLADYSVGRE